MSVNGAMKLEFPPTSPFSLASFGIADVGGNSSFIAPFTDIRCINQNGSPIAGCVPSGPSVSISNKFPFTVPPAGSAVDFGFFEPFSLNVLDPNFRVPYAMNYNLTIQRETPGKMIVSVGYVGSVARHLESTHELNPGINAAGCSANPDRKSTRLNSSHGDISYAGSCFTKKK